MRVPGSVAWKYLRPSVSRSSGSEPPRPGWPPGAPSGYCCCRSIAGQSPSGRETGARQTLEKTWPGTVLNVMAIPTKRIITGWNSSVSWFWGITPITCHSFRSASSSNWFSALQCIKKTKKQTDSGNLKSKTSSNSTTIPHMPTQ